MAFGRTRMNRGRDFLALGIIYKGCLVYILLIQELNSLGIWFGNWPESRIKNIYVHVGNSIFRKDKNK